MASSMWQQTEEMAKKHDQGGSLWLKLAGDGDKAVVVFLGEPHPREVCFVDGKYVEFDDKLKAQGLKPSLRVALNVALFDTNEVKVLEQGVMFFKDLVRVREKYGLEKWAFEIQRHGAAKDPKTTYSILPEHQLSAEQQKAFQALPQHDLAKLYSGEGDDKGASLDSFDKKADAKGDGSISPNVAQGIVTALKALPREATDRFLQKFGIQRIKELPTSQVEKARAFLEQLQTESVAPIADTTEVDPFA
ncbi:MAG: hypothetical protein H5U40_16560 [Polyangiaceae bacterium]|nr:hypothetical protein [Polyangiaceae bacterium]